VKREGFQNEGVAVRNVEFSSSRILPLMVVAVFLQGAILFAQSQSNDKKQEKSKESDTTNLRIEVSAGDKNEPVSNASVYVRFERPTGLLHLHKEKKVEMNLRTNQEGVTKVPDVPRGKVLIQVIASGWKTFGQWYTLDKDEETIKIKLEKPPHWY
jgi:hypothetical protein